MDGQLPPHFLNLPGEIRNMIYLEILAPTGYVTIVVPKMIYPYQIMACPTRSVTRSPQSISQTADKERRISFAILRACRKTYNEAKDIFYVKNCLDLNVGKFTRELPYLTELDDGSVRILDNTREFNFLARFESVEIGFDMLQFILTTFLWVILARSTELRRLTLRNGKEIGGAFFGETEGAIYYASHRTYRYCEPLTHLNEVLDKKVKKILIFPAMRLCAANELFGNEKKLPSEGTALPYVAKRLHAAFGGELWVHGKMWMKDGEEEDGLEGLIDQVRAEIQELRQKQREVLASQQD